MLPYVKAEELKRHYTVMGCFYELECGLNHSLPCRNVLEIYKKELAARHVPLLPEALFILLKPGKSNPLNPNFCAPKIKSRNLNLIISKETLVPAKPDGSVYQLMRLMKMKGWSYVRVITLSDIREPDRKRFERLIQHPKLAKNMVHSIFSEKRINERLSAFHIQPGAPVIAAWGKEDSVLPLAEKCMQSVEGKLVGVPCQDNPSLYYHACPSLTEHKQRWLQRVAADLN